MFRPSSLAEIVGQPHIVRRLQAYVANPSPACFLFEGNPGVGKTSSAYALAGELGCYDDFSGLMTLPASELNIESARELLGRTLRLTPLNGRWKVLVLEEVDGMSSAQLVRYLKVHLESDKLPGRTTIVATSNGAGGIDRALLERFHSGGIFAFSSGPSFAKACQERLERLWRDLVGNEALPLGWQHWGVYRDGDQTSFSMRQAIASLENAAACLPV